MGGLRLVWAGRGEQTLTRARRAPTSVKTPSSTKKTADPRPAAKRERTEPRTLPASLVRGSAYEACRTEVAIRMGRFFVQHLMRLHREFDGDLEQVILLGEIGHHNASGLRFAASGELAGRGSGGAAPRLLPCNAFSLSQATGIPRETVRRKISKLERRGWVRSNPRRELFVTPQAAEHFMPLFNRDTLEDLFAVAAELDAMLRGAAAAQAAGPQKTGKNDGH